MKFENGYELLCKKRQLKEEETNFGLGQLNNAKKINIY